MGRRRSRSIPLRLLARAADDPVTSVGVVVTVATMAMIATNAAFLQTGRHPAPLFETRPFDQPSAAAVDSRHVAVQRIRMPASADLVHDIQAALVERGFYRGPVDGVSGQMTERAIRAFQAAAGLSPTGVPSEKLLAQIQLFEGAAQDQTSSIPVPVAAERAPEPDLTDIDPARRPVAEAQQLLNRLGYGPLSVDGYAGTATAEAVSRFQKDRRLTVTGALTDDVMREIRAFAGKSR